jgi:hypothetical protein
MTRSPFSCNWHVLACSSPLSFATSVQGSARSADSLQRRLRFQGCDALCMQSRRLPHSKESIFCRVSSTCGPAHTMRIECVSSEAQEPSSCCSLGAEMVGILMQPSIYRRKPSENDSEDESEDDIATAKPDARRSAAAAAWERVAKAPPQPQFRPHHEEDRLLPLSCPPEFLVRDRAAAGPARVLLLPRAHNSVVRHRPRTDVGAHV